MRFPVRRGVLSCLLVVLALMSWTASATAFSGVPVRIGIEVVSRHTATGDGGNAWGGHQPRIVRTGAGVFTAYSVPGGGYLRREWRLAQEGPFGWHVIARGQSGREPPSLVASRDGSLYVVAWPSGLPRLWTITRGLIGWREQSQAVPGRWIRSDWPYGTAAIGRGGTLFVSRTDNF